MVFATVMIIIDHYHSPVLTKIDSNVSTTSRHVPPRRQAQKRQGAAKLLVFPEASISSKASHWPLMDSQSGPAGAAAPQCGVLRIPGLLQKWSKRNPQNSHQLNRLAVFRVAWQTAVAT